ncbi:MAG: hypothetical protein K0S47_3392 [Herbinix sp.]|nr:hypothetical protein [Herbinix sp.]
MERYFELVDHGILWKVLPGQVHSDNIEMSGLGASYIVTYGVDKEGELCLLRHCVYPTLRTIPNDTHASFQLDIDDQHIPHILVNGVYSREIPISFLIHGLLTVSSKRDGILVERKFYPGAKDRVTIEHITINNETNSTLEIRIDQERRKTHSYGRGTKGVYIVEVIHDGDQMLHLLPGETYSFSIYYSARIANEPMRTWDGNEELLKRLERVNQFDDLLHLDTGNPGLDMMFRFAKIRAGESIFDTHSGLLHSPGGNSYYAATWCNDQVEYAGPWFAMTGDQIAIEASKNAYKQYIPFMSEEYTRIPSSVIAEGFDIWEGAGDRGDAAMYLYGASLFVLSLGEEETARELWPAIKWCAQYCQRRKSPEGIIRSDSDELEGRFPTDGKANLSTSSLCYGGLRLAAILAKHFGENMLYEHYTKEADALDIAMEDYFGATLHNFSTYRYSKGYDTLRAWICLPLCMGIQKRIDGTLDAMLSDYLWTPEGMLSCELGEENPSSTIWDRATLYGFKCAFLSGKANEIWKAFEGYCEKRLLSDRVPYAVEAYPEGDKRHLSGESALFCRIITEGILGITPKGMNSFSFMTKLPDKLDHLYLRKIYGFGKVFDILIEKEKYQVIVDNKVISQGSCGQRILVTL